MASRSSDKQLGEQDEVVVSGTDEMDILDELVPVGHICVPFPDWNAAFCKESNANNTYWGFTAPIQETNTNQFNISDANVLTKASTSKQQSADSDKSKRVIVIRKKLNVGANKKQGSVTANESRTKNKADKTSETHHYLAPNAPAEFFTFRTTSEPSTSKATIQPMYEKASTSKQQSANKYTESAIQRNLQRKLHLVDDESPRIYMNDQILEEKEQEFSKRYGKHDMRNEEPTMSIKPNVDRVTSEKIKNTDTMEIAKYRYTSHEGLQPNQPLAYEILFKPDINTYESPPNYEAKNTRYTGWGTETAEFLPPNYIRRHTISECKRFPTQPIHKKHTENKTPYMDKKTESYQYLVPNSQEDFFTFDRPLSTNSGPSTFKGPMHEEASTSIADGNAGKRANYRDARRKLYDILDDKKQSSSRDVFPSATTHDNIFENISSSIQFSMESIRSTFKETIGCIYPSKYGLIRKETTPVENVAYKSRPLSTEPSTSKHMYEEPPTRKDSVDNDTGNVAVEKAIPSTSVPPDFNEGTSIETYHHLGPNSKADDVILGSKPFSKQQPSKSKGKKSKKSYVKGNNECETKTGANTDALEKQQNNE